MNPLLNQLPATRPVGRPPKIATLVPSRTLAERARLVNEFHNRALEHYGRASCNALLCGLELMAARLVIHHGEWLPWIEKNCEFEKTAVYKYIAIAEASLPTLQKRYPELLEYAGGMAPSQLKAADRKQLVAAVREWTAGKTIQELQLELHLNERKEPGTPGGSRAGAGRPTRQETRSKDAEAAAGDWAEINKRLNVFFAKHQFEYLSDLEVQKIRETLNGALQILPKLNMG